MNTLKIEIVSDIVCPWCVIGFKNLEKAMSELKSEMQFDIKWRPYELHPEIPEKGYDKELYMEQKFGNGTGRKDFFDELVKIGKELNFDFNSHKTQRLPNTFLAHRLIWFAEDKGSQTQLSEALFKAYFTDGKDIGSKSILVELAEEVGLDKADVKNFLDSKDGGQEVADLEMNTMERSIGAVPTYIINDQYLIQGGQEPETFAAFLKKILLKEIEKENA